MNQVSLEMLRRTGMRLLAVLMAAMMLASLAGALFVQVDNQAVAILLTLALPAYPLWVAAHGRTDAQARMVVSTAVVAQPALMLFLFQGQLWQTDLHMLFFAALAASAVLCDWRALIAAAGVVAVHHLVLGMAMPQWVFLNGGSFARILLHAVILIAETVALVYLTHAMAALLDALQRESDERAAAEHATAQSRAAQAAELESVVSTIGDSLGALAAGDLTFSLRGRLPAAYSVLEAHFETTLARLRELLGAVSESARAIRTGATEISAASEDLARRTETTAHRLDETNQATVRMDGQLKTTAGAAETLVARADEAIGTVRESRAVADVVVQAMRRVAESARGIDTVIEGVDKIAFQTRVLAMNAAVEAGRAGEAGRGFAVVADLVSALAMRAEEEAKRAREQLTVTQGDIGHAVEAVGNVDTALDSIAHNVGEVHRELGAIAQANQEQASAIGAISGNVAAVDQATQQNAAMVEQASATARTLMHEVEALVSRAERFQVEPAAAAARVPQRLAA